MSEELAALDRTGTWDLVPLPPHAVPITCKWVFKIKTKSDGSIERYKARLVARGFQQTKGHDYDETFAPVAHMTTVRTLIAVVASCSWTADGLRHLDTFGLADRAPDQHASSMARCVVATAQTASRPFCPCADSLTACRQRGQRGQRDGAHDADLRSAPRQDSSR